MNQVRVAVSRGAWLWFILFANTAAGQATSSNGQVVLLGNGSDIASIRSLIDHCRSKSARFEQVMSFFLEANGSITRISLERNLDDPPGVLLDRWGIDMQILDMDDFSLFPPYQDSAGRWSTYGAAPSWSPTKCGLLGHFLMEAYVTQSSYKSDRSPSADTIDEWKEESHRIGREVEEAVDRQYGRNAAKVCDEELPNWHIIYFDVEREGRHELRLRRTGYEQFAKPVYCKSANCPVIARGVSGAPCGD